jgi:hypothetical protein
MTAITRKSLTYCCCLLVLMMTLEGLADLTSTQKVEILEVFNQARRTTLVPAANMKLLSWNDSIASEMQRFTDLCDVQFYQTFHHPPAFFAYRDHGLNPVGVAKYRTLRMAPYFDYLTGGCQNTTESAKICRYPVNYENIVRATNEEVGCGMTKCGPGSAGTIHACGIGLSTRFEYEEYESPYPWIAGPRCSMCPEGWTYCDDDLCAEPGEATSTPSQPPTKSTKAPTHSKKKVHHVKKKKKTHHH